MPDFTILESTLYDTHGSRCLRILSKHLKMPCLGRAQKVYNVELAISALREHGRLRDGAGEVYADDIVNGHREKTVSLLWSLVSSHGLGELVDFGGLTADIKRTSGDADVESLPNDCLDLSQSQHESLLKKWASAHCARQGIRIGNLTTAFADGKAYAAILNAFMPQTGPDMCTSVTFPASNVDLKEQLRCFGCSTAFIDQIVTTTGTIPSRKTTISNLAFLASRLLPLACRQNAALVIQRVFRRYRASKFVSRRITLLRLVHACATVVETSHKLNRTAVVLQRAWRRVLDYRIDRLNRNVGAFQYMAKGWLARRRVQKYDRLSRVMGGW
jgi:abnormal spindle-like microcephaly-associated protein